MPDRHTQDAYHQVTVTLPTGATVSGKPVLYLDAMRMIAQRDAFATGGAHGETLAPMLADFHRLTGIPERAFAGLSLGEVVDTVNAFFGWRRPAMPRTAPVAATPSSGA